MVASNPQSSEVKGEEKQDKKNEVQFLAKKTKRVCFQVLVFGFWFLVFGFMYFVHICVGVLLTRE